MAAENTAAKQSKQPSSTWTAQDDAEYNRLAVEMNEDVRLQFTFFMFAITTSAAIFGLFIREVALTNLPLFGGLPSGLFFLTPLIVLTPTSFLILNRARTRNRKVAYMIISFEYKRLCTEGITQETPLREVRRLPFLPWETALHLLDRTNLAAGRRVHLAPALRYMAISYASIETLCILLTAYTSLQQILQSMWYVKAIMGIIAIGWIALCFYRTSVLWHALKRKISVQAYVEQWLMLKFDKLEDAPRYLREWVAEYRKEDPKPVPHL